MHLENLTDKVSTDNPNDNFRFIVDGLAWIFIKENKKKLIWKMWIPKAENHSLKISIYDNFHPSSSSLINEISPMVGSEISITHTEFESRFPDTSHFKDHVLKIDELHHPILKLKSRSELLKQASVLQIENTTLHPTDDRRWFEIWKHLKSDREETKISRGLKRLAVRLDGFAAITPAIGSKTNIKITGGQKFDMDLLYPIGSNKKYTIKISNHCNSCGDTTDFHHYYNIIDETTLEEDGKVKFELIRTKDEDSEDKTNDKARKRSLRAPCNVIYSDGDPEPGP